MQKERRKRSEGRDKKMERNYQQCGSIIFFPHETLQDVPSSSIIISCYLNSCFSVLAARQFHIYNAESNLFLCCILHSRKSKMLFKQRQCCCCVLVFFFIKFPLLFSPVNFTRCKHRSLQQQYRMCNIQTFLDWLS